MKRGAVLAKVEGIMTKFLSIYCLYSHISDLGTASTARLDLVKVSVFHI